MKGNDSRMRRKAVPDYMEIQRAKEDYVQLHNFYTAHEEVLGDETARKLYETLMNVDTPEDLRQWREDLDKSDLSLHGKNSPAGGVKWENVLGHYGLLLERMSPEDRDMVAFEMPKIRANGFGLYFNRNMATLCSEASNARLGKAETIAILYDQIDNHVAVGEDAERLFELFGWQTATATMGEERMSVMPVCDDILLISGLFDFQMAETMVDLMDIRVDDAKEAELSIAQQTIDAFRRKFKGDLLFPVEGLQHHSVQHCIEHEHSYPFVEKKGDTLSLIRSDAKYDTIVSGQSWNVDRERIDLFTELAEQLHLLMHDLGLQVQTIGEGGRIASELKTMVVVKEYREAKDRHGESLLVMDHGAFFEAYGDDAVFLARQLHLPLWTRNSPKTRDHPREEELQLLMMSPDIADIAMGLNDSLAVEKARNADEHMFMRLRPSFLNDCLMLEERYQDGSVLTKKNGGYAVRASKDGKTLPMKDIPRDVGERYLALPAGLVKRTYLNGIMHAAYKDEDGMRRQNKKTINNTQRK